MIGDKVEGTIAFDGLIQGKLADEAIGKQLQEWTKFVAGLGPRFNLELRGGAFSLLPDTQPVSTSKLGDDPTEAVRQALDQLCGLFSGYERAQLFSTLRSCEYRPSREVQSVYTIAGGQVGVQSRTVEAVTTPAPQPLSTKDRLKVAGMGLAMAAAVIGVAMLFPGVRAMFGELRETVKPFEAKEITVELDAYTPWLEAKIDEQKSNRLSVVLQLKPTAAYPHDDVSYAAGERAAGANARQRFTLENLARGFARIALYDDTGRYLHTGEVRVVDLGPGKTLDVLVALPDRVRVTKLKFVP
jgi:hypothetical protein